MLTANGTSEKAAKELKDIIKENKELKKQKPVSALDLPSLPRETSALLAKHLSASIALAGKMLPIHNEASRYFFIYQMLRDMVALRPGEAMVMPLKASDLMAVNSGSNSDWSYSTDATWDEQRNEDSPGEGCAHGACRHLLLPLPPGTHQQPSPAGPHSDRTGAATEQQWQHWPAWP